MHKKTLKQFLRPMVEQVWGGGGCTERMCRFFLRQLFQELLYFCVGFFQFIDAFFGSILPIFAFFAVYYVYFIKKSNSVLGTKFS